MGFDYFKNFALIKTLFYAVLCSNHPNSNLYKTDLYLPWQVGVGVESQSELQKHGERFNYAASLGRLDIFDISFV